MCVDRGVFVCVCDQHTNNSFNNLVISFNHFVHLRMEMIKERGCLKGMREKKRRERERG